MKQNTKANPLQYIKPWLHWLIPLGLYLFTLALRLWKLDVLPIAITHVELDYVINAKSIWLTGQDLAHQWSPWSLQALDSREVIAELTSPLLAPFIGPLPFSLFNARWPMAVIYSFLPLVLYLIGRRFFGVKVGVFAGLLMALNPWAWHFGRTDFEALLPVLFYLAGFWMLFRYTNVKMLWSFPFFFLGFFTYHGAKAVFLPFVVISLLGHYLYYKNRRVLKWYLVLFLCCLSLVAFFIVSYKFQPAAKRSDVIIFLNQDYLASLVNQERLKAIPSPLVTVYSNKLVVLGKALTERYIGAFSIPYLFIHGDQSGVGAHTFWVHGLFYYLDLPLLMVGFYAMGRKSRRWFWLFLGLVLVSPIASTINIASQSYVHRSALLYPLLVLFMACGAEWLMEKSRHFRLAQLVGIGLYLLLVLNFITLYVYRYPIFNSEGFFFSKRVLVEYLKRASPAVDRIYFFGSEPMALFEQYIFYTDSLNNQSAGEIATVMSSRRFNYGKLILDNRCPTAEELTDPNSILIVEQYLDCPGLDRLPSTPLRVVSLADSGTIFKIYRDPLCQSDLGGFIRVGKIDDFKLEPYADADFCKQWLVN